MSHAGRSNVYTVGYGNHEPCDARQPRNRLAAPNVLTVSEYDATRTAGALGLGTRLDRVPREGSLAMASRPVLLDVNRPTQVDAPRPIPGEISAVLRRASLRLRLDRAVTGGLIGITAGITATLVLAVLNRLSPVMLQSELVPWVVGLPSAGLMVGALVGVAWPAPLTVVARRADRALGLRERLGTALEFRAFAASPLVQGQLLDTVAATRQVGRMPRMAPAPTRVPLMLLAGLAVVTAAAVWAPNSGDGKLRDRRADAAEVTAARDEVERLGEQVALDTEVDQITKDALAARLAALAAQLDPGKIDGAEAQAEIAAAESDIKRLEDATAPQRAQALRDAAPMLQTSGATAEVGNALAAGDLAKAAAETAKLGEDAKTLSPEEQQALAAKLAEMAASQTAVDPGLAAALQAAAGTLAAGDTTAAQAALDQAAAAMQDTAAAGIASQAAAQTAGALSAARSALSASQNGQSGQGSTSTNSTNPSNPGQGQPGNGTPGAGQSGQSGQSGQPGQAGQPGQSGQSGNANSGQSGAGAAGSLSGNGQVAGANSRTSPGGRASGNAQPRQGETGQEGTRTEEPVFAPSARLGPDGQQEFIPGQEGVGQEQTGTQSGAGLATDASVPYSAVYGEYAQQASRDLEQGAVPPPLQDYVRDYFSALEPVASDDEEPSP